MSATAPISIPARLSGLPPSLAASLPARRGDAGAPGAPLLGSYKAPTALERGLPDLHLPAAAEPEALSMVRPAARALPPLSVSAQRAEFCLCDRAAPRPFRGSFPSSPLPLPPSLSSQSLTQPVPPRLSGVSSAPARTWVENEAQRGAPQSR